jgi:hypothetical protein
MQASHEPSNDCPEELRKTSDVAQLQDPNKPKGHNLSKFHVSERTEISRKDGFKTKCIT